MKKGYYLYLFMLMMLAACNSQEPHLRIQTSLGDIHIKLYNSTPLHRDNFLKNVREGIYDSLLFHRIVRDFIIQGGDTASRHAPPGAHLGDTDMGYTVAAEIGAPHLRGALAAARLGDLLNPSKASDPTQFYIVQGRQQTEESLDKLLLPSGPKMPPALREKYLELGGAPQLDGQYTVFGEIVSGMEVVDRIGALPRDGADRPLQDIWFRITLEQ